MIETERLILRPWKEADAPVLFRYACDPDIGPIAGWPPHTSEEDSLHSADMKQEETEIGYWIGKPYWGRGLIPEAVMALLARCFGDRRTEHFYNMTKEDYNAIHLNRKR